MTPTPTLPDPLNIPDTRARCRESYHTLLQYVLGRVRPHYPLPAIRQDDAPVYQPALWYWSC
jgi:hypothetical protein